MKLTSQATELLQRRLQAYVDTLNTVVAALGLEGEWQFDAAKGELTEVIHAD